VADKAFRIVSFLLENKVKRKTYSPQEWFLLLLPLSQFGGVTPAVPINYLTDPRSLQFLYSVIPEVYQNRGVLMALVVYETWNMFFGLCFSSYGLFIMLGSIQGSIEDLDSRIQLLRQGHTFVIVSLSNIEFHF